MLNTYGFPEFPYFQYDDQKSGKTAHHSVVEDGGGPVGLTAALDLAS